MTEFQEYRQTTNSSVFKKLHKRFHTDCSYCAWHGPYSENDCWKGYTLNPNNRNLSRFPNWKLCSKNKKQWMKKNFIFEEQVMYRTGEKYQKILW